MPTYIEKSTGYKWSAPENHDKHGDKAAVSTAREAERVIAMRKVSNPKAGTTTNVTGKELKDLFVPVED